MSNEHTASHLFAAPSLASLLNPYPPLAIKPRFYSPLRAPPLSSSLEHSYDPAFTRLLRNHNCASTYNTHRLMIYADQSPRNLALRKKALVMGWEEAKISRGTGLKAGRCFSLLHPLRMISTLTFLVLVASLLVRPNPIPITGHMKNDTALPHSPTINGGCSSTFLRKLHPRPAPGISTAKELSGLRRGPPDGSLGGVTGEEAMEEGLDRQQVRTEVS